MNRAEFFAKELHEAMREMGTRDKAIIRLVVSRSEIDLGNIKLEYQKLYDRTLVSELVVSVQCAVWGYFMVLEGLMGLVGMYYNNGNTGIAAKYSYVRVMTATYHWYYGTRTPSCCIDVQLQLVAASMYN